MSGLGDIVILGEGGQKLGRPCRPGRPCGAGPGTHATCFELVRSRFSPSQASHIFPPVKRFSSAHGKNTAGLRGYPEYTPNELFEPGDS